jgi:hypothetical protein
MGQEMPARAENTELNLDASRPADSGEPRVSDVPNPDLASGGTTTPSTEPTRARRRSGPRLPLEFPVLISYQAENGERSRKNGKTISVSVNGALLAISEMPAVGQPLCLINGKTGDEIQCTVRSVKQKSDNLNHVGIEFATWSPEFWEITFPREAGDPVEPQPPQPKLPKKIRSHRRSRQVSAQQENPQAADAPAPDAQRSPEYVAAKPHPKGWLAYKKLLIPLVALVALAAVWTAIPSSKPASESETDSARLGLPSEVASVIASPAGFRLAAAGDFAPQAGSWLQSMRQQVSGEIAGNFAGSGQSRAYVLVRNETSWRVVILANGELRCDAQYQAVAIAGLIPKEIARRITWVQPLPFEPDGDGLLLVRSPDKPSGDAVVLFLRGTEIFSGAPVDYQQIPVLQNP